MKTYQLGSAPMIYAPGMIRWAINGAAFKKDRAALVRVVTEGWPGVTKAAATALLTEKVPYTVEGETVVFTA